MLIFIEVLIIFFTLLFSIRYNYKGVILNNNKDSTNNYVFVILSSLLLLIISGLRGPITEDFNNYTYIFHFVGSHGFSDLLMNSNLFHTEPLFNLLNKVVYMITDNEQIMIALLSFLTINFFIISIRRYSKDVSLSIFLFVGLGLLFASYNIIRQILAASCLLWGAKYIYSKQNIRYILIVLLCSMIHKTSLIGLLFLLIYNLTVSKKNIKLYVIFSITIIIGVLYYVDEIIVLMGDILYDDFNSTGYGLANGIPLSSLILPSVFILFSLFLKKSIDLQNKKIQFWFLCLISYTVFMILSLKVEMFLRFSYFFLFFLCELFPEIFDKMPYRKRRIAKVVFYLIIFFYSLGSSAAKLDFIFFWKS